MEVGDFPLKDKIVVVTGGGSGIGLQIVKQAVAAGARVVLADLRLNDEAMTFMNSYEEKHLVFQKCDVTKRQEQERLVGVAEERWGDVPDVYVSSAGLFEPASSNFWTDTEQDDYATVAVNVTAPLKLTRIATRALLRANKRGVVLLVASVAGYGNGTYAVPLYCATKHAVVGFARSMRKADAEEGVKVVALCPGVVRTPLWSPERGVDLIADFGYAEGTVLEPEEVARQAVRLVERGEYGGGTVLEVTKSGGVRVIPGWGAQPPPQPQPQPPRREGEAVVVPQEIVPPLKVEVKECLAGERGGVTLKV